MMTLLHTILLQSSRESGYGHLCYCEHGIHLCYQAVDTQFKYKLLQH